MARLLNYFFRGLIVLAPAVVTVYVFWLIISEVDQWLGFGIPGLGIAVTVVLITLFGFLASTVLARYVLGLVDQTFQRLPLVRLVYSSTRDLIDAFVGEKRRFDRPVIVSTHSDGVEKAFGFITGDALEHFELEDYVTVYLPFSYALTGAVRVYPRANVRPLAVDSAQLMAFVVSGGVTGMDDKKLPPT
ncbi:MAG: DUF502 domain-containing protein [Gemmatimonadota bacterium]